jgi:uncharacterized protein (DUF2267 family)
MKHPARSAWSTVRKEIIMVRRNGQRNSARAAVASPQDVLEHRRMGDTGIHLPTDADCLEVIDTTVQRTYKWIHEVNDELGWGSLQQSYTAMRAVLHALRDRLTVDEAAHLAAQLPMLVRGIFFEGWKPSATPVKSRNRAAFLAQIIDQYHGRSQLNPEELARATFAVVQRHVTRGEIDDVKHMLPPDTADLWPSEGFQPDKRPSMRNAAGTTRDRPAVMREAASSR